jgi:hypothetical protein
MAEGLAIASSIIAVIQLTDRVIDLCCQFIGPVRGAEKEVMQMIGTTTTLKGFLEFLRKFVDNGTNSDRLPQLHSICQPEGPLDI